MSRRLLVVMALAVVAAATLSLSGASAGDGPKLDPGKFGLTLFNALAAPVTSPTDPPGFFEVKPQEYDPAKTGLVQAAWLQGMGCPTSATIVLPNEDFTGPGQPQPYGDPACPTGDANDQHFDGLLLGKTGPSVNFASAVAELNRVKGITLTELGWDIRKQGGSAGPLGSHCGAGAPRWNIQTTTNSYFLGCNSPPPNTETLGNGWVRMRWGPVTAFCVTCPPPLTFTLQPVTGTVVRLQIVFDEGQDAGPDFFGAAFLDNIDVNGALVGHGATDAS